MEKLLNRKEAAAILGVSPGTLAVWASTGRYGLPVVKMGGLAKYRQSDLERFIQSRAVGAEAESDGISDKYRFDLFEPLVERAMALCRHDRNADNREGLEPCLELQQLEEELEKCLILINEWKRL